MCLGRVRETTFLNLGLSVARAAGLVSFCAPLVPILHCGRASQSHLIAGHGDPRIRCRTNNLHSERPAFLPRVPFRRAGAAPLKRLGFPNWQRFEARMFIAVQQCLRFALLSMCSSRIVSALVVSAFGGLKSMLSEKRTTCGCVRLSTTPELYQCELSVELGRRKTAFSQALTCYSVTATTT